MEDPDSTYAPQSPDLGAVQGGDFEPEPHPQHREYRGSVSHISPFTPTDAKSSPFAFPPTNPHITPIQQQPPPPLQLSPQQYNPYFGNNFASPYNVPQQQFYAPGMVKQEEGYGDESGEYNPTIVKMPPSRSKKMKKEEADMGENNAPGVQEGIEVRTKFPVARIKRIMQADEDVGKVAQVTPVVVSKALELFMISLVSKAAEQARSRGSKRVLAAHLKQAVLEEEQFDFLQEIVNKVADAPAKNADKQEDSDEAMEGGPKKKRSTGGRRKKKDDSDDY